jgi:hypothetical protein
VCTANVHAPGPTSIFILQEFRELLDEFYEALCFMCVRILQCKSTYVPDFESFHEKTQEGNFQGSTALVKENNYLHDLNSSSYYCNPQSVILNGACSNVF